MSKGNASPSLERRRFRPQSIRELLRELNLTPVEFARRAEVQTSQIAGWSSGFVVPTVGTIELVAKRLGVDADRFYKPLKAGAKLGAAG